MNNFDIGPFVYDDGNDNNYSPIKKMYNRGQIMTTEECRELSVWATKLYTNGHLDAMTNGRFELKLYCDDANLIPLVFEIKKRIDEKEMLGSFKSETFIKDFLAVIPTNGYIHKHTDPNDFQNNLFHVRFNVFISVPPNDVGIGNTYYNGVAIESVKCCYVLCRSGIDEHWSDVNTSDVPRISLSFGYLLPREKVDELTRDPLIGTYAKYYPLVSHDIGRLSMLLEDTPRSLEIEERGEKGSSIYTASNLMTNAQCDFITNYIESNSSLWQERMIDDTNNVECKFMQLTSNVKDYTLLDDFIFSKVGILIRKITKEKTGFNGTNDDGYTLRKIFGGTRLHVDGVHSKSSGFTKFVRCLSLIIVLNDDYDGGVLCFPNQGLKFRVQKGQAILFPPYWTHPHSVTSVGQGQARYTINTWILEKFID